MRTSRDSKLNTQMFRLDHVLPTLGQRGLGASDFNRERNEIREIKDTYREGAKQKICSSGFPFAAFILFAVVIPGVSTSFGGCGDPKQVRGTEGAGYAVRSMVRDVTDTAHAITIESASRDLYDVGQANGSLYRISFLSHLPSADLAAWNRGQIHQTLIAIAHGADKRVSAQKRTCIPIFRICAVSLLVTVPGLIIAGPVVLSGSRYEYAMFIENFSVTWNDEPMWSRCW